VSTTGRKVVMEGVVMFGKSVQAVGLRLGARVVPVGMSMAALIGCAAPEVNP
jgi:hypothetical protein